MEHKHTNTEKKFVYEGDRGVAKRSKQMLETDMVLKLEFEKTLELFDIFVEQPRDMEHQKMLRFKKVIDWLTQGEGSAIMDDNQFIQSLEGNTTEHNKEVGDKLRILNQNLSTYNRII